MTFYEQFSKYYDLIFPAGKNQISFINHYFNENKKVLDMACATGEYTLALSDLGFEVIGVDLDQAMINTARSKAEKRNSKAKFLTGNMLEVDNLFNHRFNGLVCIGNSIVHLKDTKDIEKALRGFYNCLDDKGVMILQNINYDRIIDKNIKELPTIENKDQGVKFLRKYDYNAESHTIWFNTTLILPDQREFNNSIPLYPLRMEQLKDILEDIGFNILGIYGSFSKEDVYNNNSYGLVVVAQK